MSRTLVRERDKSLGLFGWVWPGSIRYPHIRLFNVMFWQLTRAISYMAPNQAESILNPMMPNTILLKLKHLYQTTTRNATEARALHLPLSLSHLHVYAYQAQLIQII